MFLNKIELIPVDDKIYLIPVIPPDFFSNQILATPTVFALIEKSSVVMAMRTHSKRQKDTC